MKLHIDESAWHLSLLACLCLAPVSAPQSFAPRRSSTQRTTAPIAATGIAAAGKIEVTSLSSPGRLSHPAE